MAKDFQTKTFDSRRYYVDGVSGNDANSGTRFASPKKTIEGIKAALPDRISHNTTVQCEGPLDGVGGAAVFLSKHVDPGVTLLFSGFPDEVAAGPASETATSNDATFFGVAGTPWAVNTVNGMFIKPSSGAQGGNIRSAFSNDTNTVFVHKDWASAPGNVAFAFVKPRTVLNHWIDVQVLGGGTIRFQRFDLTANGGIWNGPDSNALPNEMHSDGIVYISACTTGAATWGFGGWHGNQMVFGDEVLSVIDQSVDTAVVAGVGNWSSAAEMWFDRMDSLLLNHLITRGRLRVFGGEVRMRTNFHLLGAALQYCNNASSENIFDYVANQRISELHGNGTYPALVLIDSNVRIGTALANDTVKLGAAAAKHAIEMINSRLELNGQIAALAACAGFNLYAHANSHVDVAAGNLAAIIANFTSGALGAISLDGANEFGTWTDVQNGEAVESAASGSRVKIAGPEYINY